MISFYLRSPSASTSAIMLYASFNGIRVRRSIGIPIPPKAWDNTKGRLRPLTKEYILINTKLNEMADKGNATILYHRINRADLTADELISEILKSKPKPKRTNVLQRFEEFIAFKTDRLKPSSVKILTTIYNNLKDYGKAPAMTLAFFKEYEHYMVRNKYNPNVILKHIQILNAFASWCGTSINYKSEMKRKSHDSISLTEDEIDAMWDVKCAPMYVNARKIFVLMCFTGMRISDALLFKPSKVQEIKGTRCIVYNSTKTGKKCVIPVNISPYIDIIINDMFHVISEQKVSEMMKELARRAGLTDMIEITRHEGQQHKNELVEKYKLVSSHTGRRSFVSNMFYRGYTPAEVMPMTGHTMTSIISIYNKTTAEDNAVKLSGKISQ